MWTGPYQICKVPSRNVLTIRDPLEAKKNVHPIQPKYPDGDCFELTEEMKSQFLFYSYLM